MKEQKGMLKAKGGAAFIGIASILIVGCGDVAPLQEAELALDKRGANVSISLEVQPRGTLNIKDTYVLALSFDASSGRGAIEKFFGTAPTRSTIRMRVNLVRTDGGWDEHVPFSTCASAGAIDACSGAYVYEGSKDQSVVSMLRQRGISRSEANMEIASFRFPSFGRYRIDLEMIDDQPVLRGVLTRAYVTLPFGYPK